MLRDMDMIREILLVLEAQGGYAPQDQFLMPGYDIHHDQADAWNFDYQLKILLDGGLIFAEYSKYKDKEVSAARDDDVIVKSRNFYVSVEPIGLTWKGHEFLDNIRDPAIWRETKDGAKKLGGFSIELLGALAKGLVKKKIEDHTGIKL